MIINARNSEGPITVNPTGGTRVWTGEAAGAYQAGYEAGIAAEREACAQLAEQEARTYDDFGARSHASAALREGARLIRARQP